MRLRLDIRVRKYTFEVVVKYLKISHSAIETLCQPLTHRGQMHMRSPLLAGRIWRHAAIAMLVTTSYLASGLARGEAVPVTATDAVVGEIVNSVRLSGTVVAPRAARVSTAVAGLVERVAVELGDRVQAGDILVQLDDAIAEHDVAQSEAAIDEAEAELADARRRLRIAERLAPRGNMPESEFDARKAQVRIATAVVERLKSEAARQRENLRRHSIMAPFAGVVAEKATEVGEWVAPGTAVAELIALTDLRVDIPVPEKYYPQLQADMPIQLEFDALPGQHLKARRIAMVPVSDPVVRTFTLRVRPVEDTVALTPGMSARVMLQLVTGERGIVIPRDAVIRYPDGRTTVWVIKEAEGKTTVAERQIRLGRAFDNRVHIREGLDAGESIVLKGNESLLPNQRVRLIDESS